MRINFAFTLFLLLQPGLISCSKTTPVLDQSARASLNLSVPSLQTKVSSKEEKSPEIRAAVLEAIQEHMFSIGRFPTEAVSSSALISLHPSNERYALLDSDWAYKARVRINLKTYSVQHDFLVFQRNGNYIVRKISI